MIVPSRLCLIYTGCQIKARINFKILTTIFNCGTGRVPTYLIELSSVNRRQGLRSASDHGMNYDVPFNKKTWFIMIEASSQLDKKYGITCRCI